MYKHSDYIMNVIALKMSEATPALCLLFLVHVELASSKVLHLDTLC